MFKPKEWDTHHKIAYTEEEKDRGVVIDGILDFEEHINIKINKAILMPKTVTSMDYKTEEHQLTDDIHAVGMEHMPSSLRRCQ